MGHISALRLDRKGTPTAVEKQAEGRGRGAGGTGKGGGRLGRGRLCRSKRTVWRRRRRIARRTMPSPRYDAETSPSAGSRQPVLHPTAEEHVAPLRVWRGAQARYFL